MKMEVERGERGVAKNYVKPERLLLRTHPEFSEKWVQQLIADDPSILGLDRPCPLRSAQAEGSPQRFQDV